MAVKIIMGLQYGDEGKGRATHYEAQNAKVVIRATGGANAGHTVVANGKKYTMHLLPSAIIRPDVVSIIGPGVVADLEVLSGEIKSMKDAGIRVESDNFMISERTHITLPHHKLLDKFYEILKDDKVGTTGRGVGPTYEEKARRTNIRMRDLFLDDKELKHKIAENLKVYNMLACGYNQMKIVLDKNCEQEFPFITADQELEYCREYGEILKPYIHNTYGVIENAIKAGDNILIEGAQSYWLDNDHGDYPMTTSSNPNASGTASGAGIGPTFVDEVIGVMKAYTSRVGNGPFVTEQINQIGEKIRELGDEYGKTTGRPRRCGWLDLLMIKSTVVPNGVTSLCLNHLDTIGKFDTIMVCTGYDWYYGAAREEITDVVPIDRTNCVPIYKEFEGGWSTEGVTTYDELPDNAKAYIEFIEEYTGVPIKYIGIGADEKDTIVR